MKVRAIKEYFDKEKKKTIKPNTVEAEFEVSEERGGVLLVAGVVEDITEEQKEDTEADGEQVEDSQEDTEADEEKPKRPRKKKEPKNEQ